MNLQEIKDKFNQIKGQANQVSLDLANAQAACESIQKEITFSEKAQGIIQSVASKTQQELEYRICEPVSLALAAVYDNPYRMVANFKITGKGNTECHLGFERNGNISKPLAASGGGPIAIASFALRVGSWSLAQPRSRPVMVNDEPFGHIDKEKIPGTETTTMHLAGQMLKQMTLPPPAGLGLQIILITHIKELISEADQIIDVSMKNGISTVKERAK